MIQLPKCSGMLCGTFLHMSRSCAFHTNVSQRQLKDKASDRRNSLVEAKDKPFSELTLGEKGRYMKIYISDSCYTRYSDFYVYFSVFCIRVCICIGVDVTDCFLVTS